MCVFDGLLPFLSLYFYSIFVNKVNVLSLEEKPKVSPSTLILLLMFMYEVYIFPFYGSSACVAADFDCFFSHFHANFLYSVS